MLRTHTSTLQIVLPYLETCIFLIVFRLGAARISEANKSFASTSTVIISCLFANILKYTPATFTGGSSIIEYI